MDGGCAMYYYEIWEYYEMRVKWTYTCDGGETGMMGYASGGIETYCISEAQ